MQAAVPTGTGSMAAIVGLEDTRIIEICQKASNQGVVEAVNFNSPDVGINGTLLDINSSSYF